MYLLLSFSLIYEEYKTLNKCVVITFLNISTNTSIKNMGMSWYKNRNRPVTEKEFFQLKKRL